ncbi:trans-resveratrol di-O-methyltransferase-like [Rhodamnia argentea]|uniref:Trans-resveratrol di-O-methyltransferase-like n=1 Tax=Rhodamnia argentea TaxID=178133 RepID=A0A8B8QBW1_9MYRT|nr:trans-resveratrol di-O-methyltransferase-like [Rhodamnia argentea]
MSLGNGEGDATASELLRSQAHIWNHTYSFINSMCLKFAIELDIPDLIHRHGQPMTLLELVSMLHIQPTKAHCIHRLMRILVHSGFFELRDLDEAGGQTGYALTCASRLLVKHNPLSVAPYALFALEPISMDLWQNLSAWLRDGEGVHPSTFEMAHGVAAWEFGRRNPEANSLFDEAMASDSCLIAKVVVDTCGGVFEGLSSVVDVGGGTGTMGKAITEAFPHLECMVFDQPHVVEGSVGSERLKFVGGDMFVEIPPADAIFLKWILHDWSDEKCMAILKRCKEAVLGRGKIGKVIMIDIVVGNQTEDHRSTETQLFFDLVMMLAINGKERDEKEWEKLFVDAGFSGYKIVSRLGLRSLIEIYP